jgi:hypothetical protein
MKFPAQGATIGLRGEDSPESKEWEELIALVVEAIILARLEDAEEEESREPHFKKPCQ